MFNTVNTTSKVASTPTFRVHLRTRTLGVVCIATLGCLLGCEQDDDSVANPEIVQRGINTPISDSGHTPVPVDRIQAEKKEMKFAGIGEKAPEFDLIDQWRRPHSLSDYKGKVVVLEWFNEKCPSCKNARYSGLMQKLIRELKETQTDVVYFAINSTADKPFEEVLKGGTKFLAGTKSNIPMLMDYNGKILRAYRAQTTPHMFVIDVEGVLVYSGALSDDITGIESAGVQTHVMRVVSQLEKGEEVLPSYILPWGSKVKYSDQRSQWDELRKHNYKCTACKKRWGPATPMGDYRRPLLEPCPACGEMEVTKKPPDDTEDKGESQRTPREGGGQDSRAGDTKDPR